jgi:hypothetical protein
LVELDGAAWRVIDASVGREEVWAQVVAAVAPLGIVSSGSLSGRECESVVAE